MGSCIIECLNWCIRAVWVNLFKADRPRKLPDTSWCLSLLLVSWQSETWAPKLDQDRFYHFIYYRQHTTNCEQSELLCTLIKTHHCGHTFFPKLAAVPNHWMCPTPKHMCAWRVSAISLSDLPICMGLWLIEVQIIWPHTTHRINIAVLNKPNKLEHHMLSWSRLYKSLRKWSWTLKIWWHHAPCVLQQGTPCWSADINKQFCNQL